MNPWYGSRGQVNRSEDMRLFEKALEQYCADGGTHYVNLIGPKTEAVHAAIRAALEDLKTPVGVRDCLFSAVSDACDRPEPDGDESEAGEGEDDDSEVPPGIAKAHPTAGYFVPQEYLANPDMFVLLSKKLIELGNGNLGAGIAQFVGDRQTAAPIRKSEY